jgi:hypothetical protein
MNLKAFCKVICSLLIINETKTCAQNVNIGGLKDMLKAKPVVFSGGASANSAFYTGDGTGNREPHTYYFQGNVSANLFGQVNLPFSFSFTNAGSGYAYPTPPNRLDRHPTYKWITGHIGHVSMNFSPYTLNGHQFTGAGVDVSPDGPWKASVMVGRLQKAVAYDRKNLKILPAYERMGYGSKIGYEKPGYKVEVSTFYANDDHTSLGYKPDSLAVFPQQNLAVCYTAQFRPMKGFDLNMEYGNSALTLDDRDTTTARSNGNYLKSLMGTNGGTIVYRAVKVNMNYTFLKSTLGLGYERVDPSYRTLGAYYFNNDFENVTFNAAQAFLKDKISMSANVGVQYDNLDGKKSATTHRMVGSIHVNYALAEKAQLGGSYSNFQMYMNMQSPFQKINQSLPFQNLDTLNFVQISQNANLNMMLATRKNETQNQQLSVNLSFQDASDQQAGIVRKGSGSQFYSLSTVYNMLYLKKSFNLIVGYNLSYNTIARNDIITHGPIVSATTKLLNKKMTTGLSTSYNTSTQDGIQESSAFNVRLNGAYTPFKSHNLNLTLVNQYRSMLNKGQTSNLTGSLGYSYSF